MTTLTQDEDLPESTTERPWWIGPGIVAGLFLLFSAPVIMQLVWVYENIGDYSHGYLVPIVSGYAAMILWPGRGATEVGPSWLGIPLVAGGLLITTLGLWYDGALQPNGLGTEFVCATGLVLCIWGCFLSWIGPKRFLYFAFPFFFLLFAIPLPESLTLKVTVPLRNMISIIAGKFIHAVGIPVYQEGNLLHLAGHSLGVEDACSGIRSLWTLLAGALAIGFVAGCRRIQLIGVVFIAIPLAIMQNLLRVLVTGVLVHHFGMDYAHGWRHEVIGWLSFVLALVALIWVAMKMTEKQPLEKMDESASPSVGSMPWRPVMTMTAVLLLLGAGIRFVVSTHYDDAERGAKLQQAMDARKPLSELPVQIGRFIRSSEFDLPPRQIKKLGCNDRMTATYVGPNAIPISVMLFYWNPRSFGEAGTGAPHQPDECFPNFGWNRDPAGDRDQLVDQRDSEKALVRLYRNGMQEKVVVYRCSDYWPTAMNFSWEVIRARLHAMTESWKHPERVMGAQFSVAIYADVVTSSVDEARNEALRFAEALDPLLPQFGMAPTHLIELDNL